MFCHWSNRSCEHSKVRKCKINFTYPRAFVMFSRVCGSEIWETYLLGITATTLYSLGTNTDLLITPVVQLIFFKFLAFVVECSEMRTNSLKNREIRSSLNCTLFLVIKQTNTMAATFVDLKTYLECILFWSTNVAAVRPHAPPDTSESCKYGRISPNI